MRVLVAFLLSVLGCSLAEGRLLSKCDLKNEFVNLDLNFVAKIVYYVERMSGFNTSAVTHETEDPGSERRHAKGGGTVWPHSVTPRSAKMSPGPSGPPHQDEEAPTFYGLFQLSNLLACSDGTTPSPDICSMDCNDFIDDDISDDLKCLLKVHAAFMYMHIHRECGNKTSDYLDECEP
ncbi:lysozyme c-1 [Anarhichas minor]|uniref:lysozyme c-1 n=1 Tax=Anarhichas minor TaxID=65739 RepID=UPI003F73AC48